MAHGPKTRVAMRRRREGKTNYHRRLKLVLSGKSRLIIRTSLKSTIVQVADAHIKGDIILAASDSKQLKKDYNWNYNSGNMPSAYLVGYICGLKAKKAGINECILDLGILIHKHRMLSAFKGFLDAGIKVPFGENFFSKADLDNRINGTHIKNYAELLKKEDKEKYEKVFSVYIKNEIDPTKIVDDFNKTKKEIEKKI